MEVLPCSRIAHIERAHKPYTEDLTAHVRRNALRVAEVWMDEFKSHVYMAWNIPQEVGSVGGAGFDGDKTKHGTKFCRARMDCQPQCMRAKGLTLSLEAIFSPLPFPD